MKKGTITQGILWMVAVLGLLAASAGRPAASSVVDPPLLELVGQIGGETRAVAVEGDYAYFGVGPRLFVMNVSNPADPALVGQSAVLPGMIQAVAIAGDLAFLATGESGLRILDIGLPAGPHEIGFFDTFGITRDVAVAGNYAYLADGDAGLRIVDISNPMNPHEISAWDTPGMAQGVAVSGRYAYIADGYEGGLRIIDVAEPPYPLEVGSFTGWPRAYSVAVVENYAYVEAGFEGWHILDVRDPTNPQQVTRAGSPGVLIYSDIQVNGQIAYLPYFSIWGSRGGLEVWDVSDPTAPKQIEVLHTPGQGAGVATARNTVFVANASRGLRILNAIDPANLSEVSAYDGPGYAWNVVVQDGYAHMTSSCGGNMLHIVDVRDPAYPKESGRFATPYEAWGIATIGNVDIVTSGTWSKIYFGYLHMIDVSNPAAPSEITQYFQIDQGVPWNLAIEGNYAYIVYRNGGLRIFDVSNLAAPQEISQAYFPTGLRPDVVVTDRTVYLTGWDDGLQIVDVSDPAAPRLWGILDTPGEAQGVMVVGNYAYVADGSGGLRIIDIRHPTLPFEAGAFEALEEARGVWAGNGYAFVADYYSGLHMIDVHNPASPQRKSGFHTAGATQDVTVDGNYAYVTDGPGGLVVLRLLRDRVEGQIPLAGSQLSSSNQDTTLIFSSGAFSQTANLSYRLFFTDENTGSLAGIGHTFELTSIYSDTGEPADLSQNATYTTVVHYADANVDPIIIEDTLMLYHWDGTRWVQEPSSRLDLVNRTITATPDRLGLWAVLGKAKRVYFPLTWRGG